MRTDPSFAPDPAATGLPTRSDWVRLADRLLDSARRHASPGHARIVPPGPAGGYGRDVDGLEGFARTFLLAGFRVAGERGTGMDDLCDWYATGLAHGTDPGSPERWVRLDEHAQAKVEAASIALILDLTRPWIWDRLPSAVQERVVDYLSPAVGDRTYPQINWVWFRLVVQTFLRSVGGPWSAGEMAEDLAAHDTFRRADGWLSDGPDRAFDHYVGWALHVYPALWARMSGAQDLAAGRRARDLAGLDRFLRDALALVGADGSPLIQGRSLIYRFAAAAPFWAGALAGVPSSTPGQLRTAASRIVSHFAVHGAPDDEGLLTVGWHAPWPRLAQAYSGPASPYWASKGMLGIALPADHPVWTAPAEPLPVQRGDVLRAVRAPGWLISATRADGIVRVVNHGTDHAAPGATVADSPLYARLGYSTATCPLLDEAGWDGPADQSVALLDKSGRTTHRSGMRTLTVRVDEGETGRVGVAASTTLAHWVEPVPGRRDHGGGRGGPSRPAARLTVISLVRAAWEVRLARVDELAEGLDADESRLRVSGWPLSGDGTATVSEACATAVSGDLRSLLRGVPADNLAGEAALAPRDAGVDVHHDAGPLGGPVRVPWLAYPVRPATWVTVLVELSGGTRRTDPAACRVQLRPADRGLDIGVVWPDGLSTRTCLLHTPASNES